MLRPYGTEHRRLITRQLIEARRNRMAQAAERESVSDAVIWALLCQGYTLALDDYDPDLITQTPRDEWE